MSRPRIRAPKNLLIRDAPIVFRRRVPTGRPAARASGLLVEVTVRSDLTVSVANVVDEGVALTGRYALGRVTWDQLPSADYPISTLSILAADVADVLYLFRLRLIDPSSWTSHLNALVQL